MYNKYRELIFFMQKRGFVDIVKYYDTDNNDPRPFARRIWNRAIIKHADGHTRRVYYNNGWRYA